MLRSLEIRQPRELRSFERIPPEVLRALQLPRRRAADDQKTRNGRGPPGESGRTSACVEGSRTHTLVRRLPAPPPTTRSPATAAAPQASRAGRAPVLRALGLTRSGGTAPPEETRVPSASSVSRRASPMAGKRRV